MSESKVTEIFSELQECIVNHQSIQQSIKLGVEELDVKLQLITAILQGVHKNADHEEIKRICEKTKEKLEELKSNELQAFIRLIPLDEYYRFHGEWRHSMQSLVLIVTFLHYLQNGEQLLDKDGVTALLNLHSNHEDGFYLDLEDYLLGVLLLSRELARFCINMVTYGNYERPFLIAKFMCELDAAFRLLNLKNDLLRRKFDGLKYDVKKVEEVVYDLSIRGLKPVN